MKKKCFNIVWLIAVLLSFTACNDFLDIQPVGKVMPKTGQEFRTCSPKLIQPYPLTVAWPHSEAMS